MSQAIKKYLWLFEMIGAALILSLSIILLIFNQIILFVIGVVFLFLSILRIRPLLRTTDESKLKLIYLIEVSIEAICGIVLIIITFFENDNVIKKFLVENFGYIVGSVLYLRGFTHFLTISINKENYPIIYFVINIVLITLGTIIIVKGDWTLTTFGWIVFSIGLLTTVFITYSGYNGYKNYRNLYVSKKALKNVSIESKEVIDLPTSNEIGIEEINIDNVNEIDDNSIEHEIQK